MPETPARPALLRRILGCETGIAATEYALIAMMIAVAAATAIGTLGEEVNQQYSGIDQAVREAH